jgi:hypothetical protein
MPRLACSSPDPPAFPRVLLLDSGPSTGDCRRFGPGLPSNRWYLQLCGKSEATAWEMVANPPFPGPAGGGYVGSPTLGFRQNLRPRDDKTLPIWARAALSPRFAFKLGQVGALTPPLRGRDRAPLRLRARACPGGLLYGALERTATRSEADRDLSPAPVSAGRGRSPTRP